MSDQVAHPWVAFSKANPARQVIVQAASRPGARERARAELMKQTRKTVDVQSIDAFAVYYGESHEEAKARVLAEVMSP